MSQDLVFISGEFFLEQFVCPKEKRYLLNYFTTPIEQQFLSYYLLFNEIDNFIDHTGHFCQKRWLRILERRFQSVEALKKKAKKDFDLSEVTNIEQGEMAIYHETLRKKELP